MNLSTASTSTGSVVGGSIRLTSGTQRGSLSSSMGLKTLVIGSNSLALGCKVTELCQVQIITPIACRLLLQVVFASKHVRILTIYARLAPMTRGILHAEKQHAGDAHISFADDSKYFNSDHPSVIIKIYFLNIKIHQHP